MMVSFAERMNGIKASDIRELLKLTAQPEIISFAGGLPAPELFPVQDIKAAFDAVMDEAGPTALQYGQTEGWTPLRVQIAERMLKKNNIKTDPANIILTAGSQQGLDFIGKLFLNPGDVVVLESPSYLGAINAFKQYQPNFVEVPTDENGMIMEELDKVLATTKNAKFIYIIPDFQNPSGRTWPLERRKQFMEIINKYEIPAIEDNPYGDLRFKGEYLPALKSMDEKGLIMYFGTFSKILSPGMRIGWICANDQIMAKVNLIAQASVLQTSTITAMAVSKYLEMFDIEAHVAKILPVYKHRCELMINTMRETFPEEVKFTDPDGGLFTWCELPDYINTRDLAPLALEQKVAFVPGSGFYPSGAVQNCMRLNYSNATDERLVTGVKRLAEVIKGAMR
ncbi:MAG: PLP-dependent aminotransferase family protein [Oscillospiraceae bacterium]|nr:PLP-dependent aminotransferase family protein [Oscillospiraceae bacterium]